MQHWDLLSIPAPDGTRDPVVLHTDGSARAVLVVLKAGQALGEHQVKEHAWVTVLDGAVTTGDREFGAGSLLRFDPDERRTLASPSGARVLLLLAPWPGEGHYR